MARSRHTNVFTRNRKLLTVIKLSVHAEMCVRPFEPNTAHVHSLKAGTLVRATHTCITLSPQYL